MHRYLFAIVLAAVAAPAAAQTAPWEPERVTAGWVVTPSVVFGGFWDSNVALRSNTNLEFNPNESELVGTLNPRGEINFNGKRTKFNAGYSGSLQAYQTLPELTRYEQLARTDARFQMTPRLQFYNRQQMTLAPTTDLLDIGGLPFRRVGSQMVNSISGFTQDLSPRLKLTGEYFFQWVNFDRSDLEPTDGSLRGGYSHSPSAELSYALSRRLKIGSLWRYRWSSIDGGRQIIDTQEALGNFEYRLGPATTVHGNAGIAYLNISDTDESRTGPSFGGGIAHRAQRFVLDASYQRSFVPSFGFGGVTANQVFSAGVFAPFRQGRLYTSGNFTFRKNDPVLSQGLFIQLDSYWTTGTLGYAVSRWLRVETFVNVIHQYSSAEGTVDRTRVGVQLITSKPMRIQ